MLRLCFDGQQILGARRVERLTDLKADLESRFGVRVIISALDVTDLASCTAFFDAIPAEVRDNLDVLVNNAGVTGIPRPIFESDFSDFDKILNTNVKGVVKMITLFVPAMLKRGVGHIINVSSTVGKESGPLLGLYAGSKHFIEAVNTALRAELVATPLRVSTVSPGLTESEFVTSVVGELGATFHNGYKPLDSADIAEDIVYIASRPPHVQVVDIYTLPTAQASHALVHKVDTPEAPVFSIEKAAAFLASQAPK